MTYFKRIVAVLSTLLALSTSFVIQAEESNAFVDRNKALNERAIGS